MKLLLLLILLAPACLAQTTNRPVTWATAIEKTGLPNLHKVSDSLYRGAQPDKEGFRQLKAMGIKTVINLRSFHSDRDEMGDTQLRREHIWFKAWNAEDEEIARFLKIVSDTNHTPVFVHCQHGADRTGTMCAIYRVAVQGWSKEDAIKEMVEGGYGFHAIWQNLIRYIRQLDIAAIAKTAGTKK